MTPTSRPWWLPRHRGDEGAGLPELLVAIAVAGVVAAAVSATFVGVISTSRTAAVRTATTADARIAMEAMTRSLRVAVVPPGEPAAITAATPTSVEFYSSLARGPGQTDQRPTRVRYGYQAATGCVTETQVPAGDSGDPARPFVWTAAGTTKCLIRTSAPPAFSYYRSGAMVAADGTPVAAVLPVTEADRAAVLSVEAALDVQDRERTDISGIIARDRVSLANVIAATTAGGTP